MNLLKAHKNIICIHVEIVKTNKKAEIVAEHVTINNR